MNTLIIIYAVLGLGLIVLFVGAEVIPTHKVSMIWKEVILVSLLSVLAIGLLFIPTYLQKNEAVGNAELKAQFSDADLYYDTDNEVYFAVETNNWNPFKMYEKVEVSQEIAVQKLLELSLENDAKN